MEDVGFPGMVRYTALFIGIALVGAFFLVSALFLTGCASPNRVALASGHKQDLTPAMGVVGLRQQEIGTSINRSNISAATGGGLIFAMIDMGVNNSRAKKAESSASSIRDALIDYKPGDALAKALTEKLNADSPLSLEEIKVLQIKDASSIAQWVKENPAKTVVVLDVTYRLLPNFEGATVTVAASAHPCTGKMASLTTTRGRLPALCYYNVFSSTYRFPVSLMPIAEAGRLWSADGGEHARELLNNAFGEIAEMISHDLQIAAPGENALYKNTMHADVRNVAVPGGPEGIVVRGYIEKSLPGRAWIRCPRGELSAIPL